MRVGIIGAGLAGLTTAYHLSEKHEVVVFERESEPGGLLSSYRTERYPIERFYHHFFSGDSATLNLIRELGLQQQVVWLSGSTGSYLHGRMYPMTTPLEILRYPHLSLTEKVRLALFTRQASRMDSALLDDITARDFILHELGEGIYQSFFAPLLRSKFGANADRVSAAWLISRVAIRSDRGISGERLGYLRGGFSVLIEALVREAAGRGCTIHTGTPVTAVQQIDQKSGGGWEVNGEQFDQVIGTVAPQVLTQIGISGVPSIPYQGAACLTLALPRDVTDGIYWVNISDPAPYGAVVSHTNFAPLDWYGEHIVYLASYFSGEPDPDIGEKMLSDFCTKFSVQPDEVLWTRLAIDRQAGPLYLTGYKKLLSDPSADGLSLAGMFSPENYPERSIEGSVRAALRVVEGIRNRE